MAHMRFLEDIAPWIAMALFTALGVIELTVDHSVGYAIMCFVTAAFSAGILVGVSMGKVVIKRLVGAQSETAGGTPAHT
jgi:hypothetical protein